MTITQKNIDQMSKEEKEIFRLKCEIDEYKQKKLFWYHKKNHAEQLYKNYDEKIKNIEIKLFAKGA